MCSAAIPRSPGGTPMRRKDQENCEPASNDPGAIIAQALRRKFANRMFQDSPGIVAYTAILIGVHTVEPPVKDTTNK